MILIQGGHVVDPLTGKDGCYDVLVEDGRIREVAEQIEAAAAHVIHAEGC